MVPNASDLARRRAVFVGCVRIICFLVFWAALIPTMAGIGNALAWGSFIGPEFLVPFTIGVVVMLIDVAIWLAAPLFAALALPHKRGTGCPACGYDVRELAEPRCPECGLFLTNEFREGDVAPGPSPNAAARIAINQGLMAGIARLLAAILFLPLLAGTLAVTVGLISEITGRYTDAEDILMFVIPLTCMSAGLLMLLVPWIFPGFVGRRLCPTRGRALAHPPPPPVAGGVANASSPTADA